MDTLPLTFIHPSQAGPFQAMATSKAYYLDMAAFYCWVWKVFDAALQNRSWDLFYPAEEEWKRWRDSTHAVGYLVDVSAQWKVQSGPMWKEHNVPFHYVWEEGIATNERFRSWDPVTLGAFDESTGQDYEPGSMPTTDPLYSGTIHYDDWLQEEWPIEENVPSAKFEQGIEYYSPNVRFFSEDFEGWHKRPITGLSSSETALLTSLFYFEDIQRNGSPFRKYFRWRGCFADPYDKLSRSIMEPFRFAVNIVRETHKFRYSSYVENASSGRSLLSRLGGSASEDEASAVHGEVLIQDEEGQASSNSPFNEVRFRQRREEDRQRSASPTPSRASSGSQSSMSHRRRDRESMPGSSLHGLSVSPAPGSERRGRMGFMEEPLEGRALVESILPAADESYPAEPDCLPRWSRCWLANAVIHFQDPRAEWRIRAWLIRDPSMAATELLSKALAAHIPFSLEVPAAVLPRWARPVQTYSVWEVEAGEYYTGVSQARPITFNAVGSEYAREYKLSVMEVLNRPNSIAFFFEGGLLARLALHYGNPGLITRARAGPSAAMTLHGAGHADFSRATRRESVTDPEKNILLGQSRPGSSRTETHYIWPPVVIFQARFQPFDGRWTKECESWFIERAALIKGGFVDSRTEGGWWSNLRHARRGSRVTDSQWADIEKEIVETTGASWEGARLRDLVAVDAPANDYVEP